MRRMPVLLLVTLLALGSTGGYLFLTEKIVSGRLRLTEGQLQYQQGQKKLAEGKAKLTSGERTLSEAKTISQKTKNAPWLAVAVLPIATGAIVAVGQKAADKKIAEGDQMVAEGKQKVKAGEQQLAAGKLQIERGAEQLKLANNVRIILGVMAIFFTSLFLILVFRWRQSWIYFFKKDKS